MVNDRYSDDDESEDDETAAEPRREMALDALPSTGLLSFYDRLRDRVLSYVERRGGRLGETTAQALLLIPDVFILLARMALDKDVPASTRTLLASTLAYFVLPIDLLPEALIGPTGFLDDLVLAMLVLSQAFGDELEPFAAKHWSGSGSVRQVAGDVLGAADSLVGHDLYGRIRQFLSRRGIELDDEILVEGEAS